MLCLSSTLVTFLSPSPSQASVPSPLSPSQVRAHPCAHLLPGHIPIVAVPLPLLDTTPDATEHEARHFDIARALRLTLVLLYATSLKVSINYCYFTNVTGLFDY